MKSPRRATVAVAGRFIAALLVAAIVALAPEAHGQAIPQDLPLLAAANPVPDVECNFQGGALPIGPKCPGFTYSGPSLATLTNSAGLLAYKPHNLVIWSQAFSHWGGSANINTDNVGATTDPLGGSTASKVASDGTNTNHFTFSNATAILANETYIYSVSLKSAEYTTATLWLLNTATADRAVTDVNLANCTTSGVGGVGGAPFTGASAVAVAQANGWCRVALTATTAGGAFNLGVRVYPNTANAYSGTSGNGVYTWGAQLEKILNPAQTVGTYNPTTSSAYYGPRFDYSFPGGVCYLNEEGRQNLETWSNDFTNAAWGKTAVTITASAGTSPDGSGDAQLIVPTDVSSGHDVARPGIMSGAGTFTQTLFVKASGYTKLEIFFDTGGNTVFDLGAVTATSSGGAYGSIQAFPNGWFRLSDTQTVTAAASAIIYVLNAAGSVTYTGDGTSGVYFYQADLNQAAFATTAVPTTTATATRAPDVATVPVSAFAWNAKAGTFVSEFLPIGTTQANPRIIGDYNGAVSFTNLTGSPFTAQTFDGTHVVASPNTATFGTVAKAASAFDASGASIVLNGGTPNTNAFSLNPSTTTTIGLFAGNGNVSNLGAGCLHRVQYYNRRLQGAALRQKTSWLTPANDNLLAMDERIEWRMAA